MSKDDPIVHFEGQDMPASHCLQLIGSPPGDGIPIATSSNTTWTRCS